MSDVKLFGEAEDPFVELEPGLMINRRWKVIKKVGQGGCGTVYKVQDVKKKSFAALKVESNSIETGVLKLEVKILKRMVGRQHVAHLLQAGKKLQYSYMVTELLGMSLEKLAAQKGRAMSISTQVRVGMQCLFGLKQLHEVGFLHRDVKPANIAIGSHGVATRILHLLDFGLAREFIIHTKTVVKMREPRVDVLFRGTMHYASVNALRGNEQGRADDLWSLVYVVAELRTKLPWAGLSSKGEILNIKVDTRDEDLFGNSVPKLVEIPTHLRTLTKYHNRPDYFAMYSTFNHIMMASHFSHSDPFDWEIEEGMKQSVRVIEKVPKTIIPRGPTEDVIEFSVESSAVSVEDGVLSTEKTDIPKATLKSKSETPKTSESQKTPVYAKLFSASDFKKNELGF